jgi:hypothetical protein
MHHPPPREVSEQQFGATRQDGRRFGPFFGLVGVQVAHGPKEQTTVKERGRQLRRPLGLSAQYSTVTLIVAGVFRPFSAVLRR